MLREVFGNEQDLTGIDDAVEAGCFVAAVGFDE